MDWDLIFVVAAFGSMNYWLGYLYGRYSMKKKVCELMEQWKENNNKINTVDN